MNISDAHATSRTNSGPTRLDSAIEIDKASPHAAVSTKPTATPVVYGTPAAKIQMFAALMKKVLS